MLDRRGLTATKLGGKWEQEGVMVISANNVKNGSLVEMTSVKHINSQLFEKWMPEKLEKGDILLVSEGATFGELLHLRKKITAAIGQRLFAIRCNNDYDSRYLYYFLKSGRGQYELNSRTTGTSVSGIRQSELRQILVPDVGKKTQKKIADILESIDEKIFLNQNMNKTLDFIGKNVFWRWFVDFEFPDKNGNPYKSSGGKLVYNEELGKEIPFGWTVKKLGELIKFVKGRKPKNVVKNRKDGFLPQILIDVLDGGQPSFTSIKKMVLVKENDILMVMDGASSGRTERGLHGVLGSTLAKIEVQNVSTNYIFHFLKRRQKHINQNTTGTSIPHTDKRLIENYPIVIPNDPQLTLHFENLDHSILLRLINNNLENHILKQIRDGLLPLLMSGKIEVNVSEDKMEVF